MSSVAKTAADGLFAIAEGQQGYFTSKQAADAGCQPGSQAHHVKSGNWVRVERGIYRLTRSPQSSEEQLVIYALWTRNRAGRPEGVYSYQTALSIHDLSDVTGRQRAERFSSHPARKTRPRAVVTIGSNYLSKING